MTKLIKVKYDDLTEVDQSAPQAVEFEQIASGSVDLPVSTNKSIFLDSLDQEFKAIDSLGVVSTFGGSAGGLQPVFIDHTGIPAELIRDRIYEADFSGATAGSTLTVTFPEGTGAETFIIGFRITGLSENSSVTFQTTNSQNIFFPDATTDTSLTGVNTPTYLEFAWDQSRYVYGDVYAPIYFNLPLATSTQSGAVQSMEYFQDLSVSLTGASATTDSEIYCDRINKTVNITLKMSVTASGSSAISYPAGTLPTSMRPTENFHCLLGINVNGTKQVTFLYILANGAVSIYQDLNATPFTNGQTVSLGFGNQPISVSYVVN